MSVRDNLAYMFAAVSIVGVALGGLNRLQLKKGTGTKFNRYIAMVVAIPLAGALALQDLLTWAIVTVIMGALGYWYAPLGRED